MFIETTSKNINLGSVRSRMFDFEYSDGAPKRRRKGLFPQRRQGIARSEKPHASSSAEMDETSIHPARMSEGQP